MTSEASQSKLPFLAKASGLALTLAILSFVSDIEGVFSLFDRIGGAEEKQQSSNNADDVIPFHLNTNKNSVPPKQSSVLNEKPNIPIDAGSNAKATASTEQDGGRPSAIFDFNRPPSPPALLSEGALPKTVTPRVEAPKASTPIDYNNLGPRPREIGGEENAGRRATIYPATMITAAYPNASMAGPACRPQIKAFSGVQRGTVSSNLFYPDNTDCVEAQYGGVASFLIELCNGAAVPIRKIEVIRYGARADGQPTTANHRASYSIINNGVESLSMPLKGMWGKARTAIFPLTNAVAVRVNVESPRHRGYDVYERICAINIG